MSHERGTILKNTYRIVSLLGSGSMGNVYLVEKIKDDKRLVIKELIFKKGVGLDEKSGREIFAREAEFMKGFSHPGIPKIYETFSEDGKDYLVMDYIEGKTLEELISSGETILKNKAIKWTMELAGILDYLHNSFHSPIVYRDLKPSNVIITPKGEAKLVDFGIARYYNPDKNTDTFNYGSPGYAAPEQYKGRGQSSPQSDVFGLGVILFQMLTGYDPTLKPFTFPPMNLHDDRLESIVRRAIELNPLKRYISVMEFKEVLEKYLSGGENISSNRGISYYSSPPPKAPEFSLMTKVVFFLCVIASIIFNIFNLIQNPSWFFHGLFAITFYVFIVGGILWVYLKIIGYIIYTIKILTNKERIFLFLALILAYAFIKVKVPSYETSFLYTSLLFTFPGIWSVVYFVYCIYVRAVSLIDMNKQIREELLPQAVAVFLIFAIFPAILIPNFLKARSSGQLAACESNLKNIATALEMYATDFNGDYPPSLDYLTMNYPGGGAYMKALPNCPAIPTEGYIYESANDPDNFTLVCGASKGHINTGTVSSEGHWPQYTPGEGIRLK